jgi:hypothetical protein
MHHLNSIKIVPPYETGYSDFLSPTHSALIHITAVASGQHPSLIISELIDVVCSLPPNPDSTSSLIRLLSNATEAQRAVDDNFEKGLSLLLQGLHQLDKDKPNE